MTANVNARSSKPPVFKSERAVTKAAANARADWRSVVAPYQQPDVHRALLQIVTTVGLLLVSFWVLYRSLALPYWVTLALSLPAAGFFVRTFIIMHDCGHGSFLPWRRANEVIGFITGVLTLTPYGQWRRDHALHHASSGDLERRGHGDVTTLTVREYAARSKWGRLRYRAFRHPLVLFGLGPLHLMFNQRFRPPSTATGRRQTLSVWGTNAAIVAIVTGLAFAIGIRAVLIVYLPVYFIAAATGIWLFYVQHQFESTYWTDHAEWDYAEAAIRGSSYYKLPPILQWFTGNIGLHHVHHLAPRIPNYKLQRCHDENPLFHDVTVVTLAASPATLRLTLWDETQKRLIGFKDMNRSPSV